MIGPLGRQGPAATLGQHRTQMTQRPGTLTTFTEHINFSVYLIGGEDDDLPFAVDDKMTVFSVLLSVVCHSDSLTRYQKVSLSDK